jgi:hypothetical protein
MYRQVRTALLAASAFALVAARANSRHPVSEEQARDFIQSFPDQEGHYAGNRHAFKRGQRSERARSKARQNRRLHPRAQTR